MTTRRIGIAIIALLLAGACSDGTAPFAGIAQEPRFLRWEGGITPHFVATGPLARSADALDGIAVEGVSYHFVGNVSLSLTTNKVSFWSVRGRDRTVQIDYKGANGAPAQPFLRLTTYEPEYVPGRGYLAWGDSVLVTVTVDPRNIAVQLEPHGLRFNADDRTRLKLYWGGAGGDLNGDGVVNKHRQQHREPAARHVVSGRPHQPVGSHVGLQVAVGEVSDGLSETLLRLRRVLVGALA